MASEGSVREGEHPVWPGITRRLEGSLVVLEPLEARHEDGMFAVARDERIWRWITHNVSDDRGRFGRWFQATLDATASGEEQAFATVSAGERRVIGTTRYMNLRPHDRALEIGWTWLHPSAWGTGANVEAKLLMLEHAFERLGCARVEFKTDARNERSRAALDALPAQFEGIHRKHRIIPGVGQRDSAWYSVIDDEWPAVRENLKRRLDG